MSVDTTAPAVGLTAYVAGEIRAHLGRHSISRSELARRLGVDDTWVGKRLNERTEMSLTDLQRIATALGVNVVDLISRPDGGHLVSSPIDPLAPRIVATAGAPRPRRAVRLPRQRHPANRIEVLA